MRINQRQVQRQVVAALHDRLTQRFVDRRGAFLVRQLAGSGELLAAIRPSGEVLVEGHFVGRLDGFRFVPDATEGAVLIVAAWQAYGWAGAALAVGAVSKT